MLSQHCYYLASVLRSEFFSICTSFSLCVSVVESGLKHQRPSSLQFKTALIGLSPAEHDASVQVGLAVKHSGQALDSLHREMDLLVNAYIAAVLAGAAEPLRTFGQTAVDPTVSAGELVALGEVEQKSADAVFESREVVRRQDLDEILSGVRFLVISCTWFEYFSFIFFRNFAVFEV